MIWNRATFLEPNANISASAVGPQRPLLVLTPWILAAAHWNDGGISFGGSPQLLRGHPTVRMAKELIRMRIDENQVRVDCTFWMENRGKACDVRMGFPDEAYGADDPEEEGDAKVPPGSLENFRSTVNGREVPTEIVRGKSEGGHAYWHAKVVRFAGGKTTVVRDTYTTTTGGSMTSHGTFMRAASYIVHSGSSWHGNIGETKIVVEFAIPGMGKNLKTVKASSIKKDAHGGLGPIPRSTVAYSGIGAPTVKGTMLTFIRKNWRPTVKDDLELHFDDHGGGS